MMRCGHCGSADLADDGWGGQCCVHCGWGGATRTATESEMRAPRNAAQHDPVRHRHESAERACAVRDLDMAIWQAQSALAKLERARLQAGLVGVAPQFERVQHSDSQGTLDGS